MSAEDYFDGDYDGPDNDDIELYGCTLVHETEKAWLIKHKGKQAWFPKSQCEWHHDESTLIYPSWLYQ